jgi:hypothetical protein
LVKLVRSDKLLKLLDGLNRSGRERLDIGEFPARVTGKTPNILTGVEMLDRIEMSDRRGWLDKARPLCRESVSLGASGSTGMSRSGGAEA